MPSGDGWDLLSEVRDISLQPYFLSLRRLSDGKTGWGANPM
jgi:hypothetical protein